MINKFIILEVVGAYDWNADKAQAKAQKYEITVRGRLKHAITN